MALMGWCEALGVNLFETGTVAGHGSEALCSHNGLRRTSNLGKLRHESRNTIPSRLRWRRKNGQSAKVGSTSMKDGLYDWQTEAVFG